MLDNTRRVGISMWHIVEGLSERREGTKSHLPSLSSLIPTDEVREVGRVKWHVARVKGRLAISPLKAARPQG